MEKLSITCYSMESLPSIERLQNLQELHLKDCCSLEALPKYLGGLVKLCTLNISGTKIKSVPDCITSKLQNLKNLIAPKCFKQDGTHKYPRKEFTKVSIDEIVELYFNDMSDDDDGCETSRETSNEGHEIELNSIEGNNEAVTKELEDGTINEQPSPHGLHVTPIIGDFRSNRRESSNLEGQSIPAIQNDMKGIKRKEISTEMLQSFWSRNMTVEEAGAEIGVKRSTVKRRLRDLGLKWQSSRKGKQHLDAKKRKQNNKAPFGSDCSQQNLVNPGNLAAHTKTVGECISGSGLHMLANPVSSNFNVVINSIPATTMETIRDDLIATQCDMDCHQRAQEQLDVANELTLSNTLQQNENLSNFVVKATYKEDTIKFKFSLSCSIDQLKEEVANRLELEANTFKIKYQDEDKDWILVTCISDLEDALKFSRSNNSSFVRLLILPKI